MQAVEATVSRIVSIRLDPGEDVLEGLRAAVRTHEIVNAAILSGVGSLDRYHFHVVSSTELPVDNAFVRGEGPFDILSITGIVIDGRVHAHITFSDTEIAMGGHLEEGCRVLTFCMVHLAALDDVGFGGWDTPGPLVAG